MSGPVFLYNGPHPVHERMAEQIDAEFVACEQAGAVDRLRAGAGHDFGERPVLIEGGVPLFEAAALSLFGSAGPIVELAADATLIDIATPLPERPAHERLAHRIGERFVDATIAVSDTLAAHARRYDRPVRVVHPFVRPERYDRLRDLDIQSGWGEVMCIGKYRHKNGQDILREAASDLDGVTVHFVGSGTEAIAEAEGIETHGFVEEREFVDLLERAALSVFPARVGAYPVAVLESLLAGTPVVTTPYVGNADLVRSLDPALVVEPEPPEVAGAIEWAQDADREGLSQRARSIGVGFGPELHLQAFEERFSEVLGVLRGG